MKLNVGCGRNIKDGWVNLDYMGLPGVDIVANLEGGCTIPLADDTVDEFLLSHVIEHIRDTLPLMQELHRIARPGAQMTIRVPYGASDDAHEDPTHVRCYFLKSFNYFSQPYYWRADYGYRGDWRTTDIYLVIDPRFTGCSAEQVMSALKVERNVVSEMVACLTAIKPIRAPEQRLHVPPNIHLAASGANE